MDKNDQVKLPTMAELEEFLTEYGWQYRKTTYGDGAEALIAPYSLGNDLHEGVLVTFVIVGEYVMVSTRDFMTNVAPLYGSYLLELNDQLKLVKIFATNELTSFNDDMNLEIGFELWAEAWNKSTFMVFMDCLALAIDKAIRFADEKSMPYSRKWIVFEE